MTKQIDDGGQAFPDSLQFSSLGNCANSTAELRGGMSLRDWFAGMALAALLSEKRAGQPQLWYDPPASAGSDAADGHDFLPKSSAAKWAVAACVLADAMIAARSA